MKRFGGMEKEAGRLLGWMMAGCFLYNAAWILASCLFYRRMPVILGFAGGMAAAVCLLCHMAWSLSRSLGAGDEMAVRRRIMASAMLRKLVLCAAYLLILIRFAAVINPISFLIGMMGIRAGVWLGKRMVWERGAVI